MAGEHAKSHEWVRLRGFSQHGTREDVRTFLDGLGIFDDARDDDEQVFDNDLIRAEFDAVRGVQGVRALLGCFVRVLRTTILLLLLLLRRRSSSSRPWSSRWGA